MKKEWFEEEAEKQNVSDFWTIPEGKSKVRLMTQPVQVFQLSRGKYPKAEMLGMVDKAYYDAWKKKYEADEAGEDKVSMQGWAWGIVRGATGADDELKIIKLGLSLLGQLTKIKQDTETAYNDYPMPYDIKIDNTGEGANRYMVTPSIKQTEITDEEMAKLNKKKSISDIIQRIKDKKAGKKDDSMKPADYPTDESIRPEDIGF